MAALTYGLVADWRAEPLGTAGDGLKQDITALEASRDKLESQTIPPSWLGLPQVLAEVRRNRLVDRIETHIDGKRTLQRALYAAEAEVVEIERLVKEVETLAKAKEFQIHDDGSVTDTSTPPTFDSRWEAEEWRDSRQTQAQEIADDVTTILGKAAHADATIANGVPAGHVQYIDEYGVPDPDVAERWATLTDAERQAIIEEMIEELAEESGIDNPHIVYDPDLDANGQWSDGEPGTVTLNPDILDDPHILHTVPHEVRHGRQHEAVRDQDDWHWPWSDDPFDEHEEDGISEEQAEEWEDNFNDYQSTQNPGVSYEDYFNQPVERDAREAGKDGVESLTEEELERLLEEGQQ